MNQYVLTAKCRVTEARYDVTSIIAGCKVAAMTMGNETISLVIRTPHEISFAEKQKITSRGWRIH